MKFLLEQNVTGAEVSSDLSPDGQKRMYISGPFLMYDKKNRNGRIYPKKVMEAAVKEYDKEYIKSARAMGEMLHPSRTNIDPERACILTTSLENDGKNYYYGKAKVLSTPMGKLLQNLLEDGVRLGVSSRGLASVSKQGGATIVQPDFRLTVAADCVCDPSVAEAFVDHLMEEKSYIFVDGMYMEREVFEEQQRILAAPLSKLQEAKLEAFQNFLNKIR